MKNQIDILAELAARRAADAREREAHASAAAVEKRALAAPRAKDFEAALRRDGINVIAELKKASPSEGLIREDFRHRELAAELAAAGAAALSVLCEPHRFLGAEEYLREVRETVALPILYKDFISTRYQIAEARAAGADAVLLIAAILDDAALAALRDYAHSLGMCALVETHDETEIARAAALGCRVIGVNCRDLRSFATDAALFQTLIAKIPPGCVRVAESGLHSASAIAAARAAGAGAFLVGTALMRAPSPGAKLREFIEGAGAVAAAAEA